MEFRKDFTSDEFKQMQQALNWSNEEAASKLGVNLKTITNWRAGVVRLPKFLRYAMDYLKQVEGIQ